MGSGFPVIYDLKPLPLPSQGIPRRISANLSTAQQERCLLHDSNSPASICQRPLEESWRRKLAGARRFLTLPTRTVKKDQATASAPSHISGRRFATNCGLHRLLPGCHSLEWPSTQAKLCQKESNNSVANYWFPAVVPFKCRRVRNTVFRHSHQDVCKGSAGQPRSPALLIFGTASTKELC